MKFRFLLLLLIFANYSCSDNPDINAPIELSAPVINNSKAFTNEIEISWSRVSDAVNYEVDVALDLDFNQLLSDYNSIVASDVQFKVEDLKPSTTYFIRVKAINIEGKKSQNSNVIEITTLEYKVCESSTNFEFNEKDGVVKVEFEDALFGEGWELISGDEGTSGQGYMVWNQNDYFSKPSSDLTTYKLNISTPGTYQFVWYSAVTMGTSGTEHNDTWLRFPDADDYYAKKDTAIIYPKGTGKTPNPEGASTEGWFKNYRSGNDLDFKWQSRTSDRDPHEIYVKFDEAKTYSMEISARSKGHGIDKFVLFLESINQSVATETSVFSEIICL